MMSLHRLLLGALALLPFLTSSCSESRAADAPNVLILSIDTLRADALGCYGSQGGHTPNIDRLAERGVLFQRALAPMATTFPSHSSMFTGLYPRVHGVRWNGHTLDEDRTTLAEVLDDAGFETGAFVSYKAMVARGGLHQGFDSVSDEKLVADSPRIRDGGEVNRLAFEYLDGLGERGGTFLWLHYFEPHSPYPLTDYASERLVGYEGPLADGASIDEIHVMNDKKRRTPADVAAFQTLYDGRVREADRLVGELIEGLEERGRLDDTILVLVGDHGQLLGEHGHVGHGAILWQEVLEVPFMIVDPRSKATGEVQTRVGVVDLMPTVLDLLSLEAPAGMQGRSLARALYGEALEDELYFAEVRIADPKQARPRGQNEAVAVFHEHHKFVLQGDEEVLYDLNADPGEGQALELTLESELVNRLRPLARFHKELSPEARGQGAELTEAMKAELEALGYLGGEEASE